MKLDLFSFIDETMAYYKSKSAIYQYAEGKLNQFFSDEFLNGEDPVISLRSRIKAEDSLKEKLIRNQFYIQYEAGKDAISHLTDLIGITMQCRFIRNEDQLYKTLFNKFTRKKGTPYFVANNDPDIFIDLSVFQPQIQRNGFTIYRIDGYYTFNDEIIRFELQIKSLVHAFWSEIEHEVVYKNPDFILYDQFNKDMLGAIRDNLDVVDRQLEIMYDEISHQSKQTQIGMDEVERGADGVRGGVHSTGNHAVGDALVDEHGADIAKASAETARQFGVTPKVAMLSTSAPAPEVPVE